jgi:hypothetical protein
MSLTFTDSESSNDIDSDCEDEYNEFCKTNAGMNGFIYQQALVLSRLKKLERRVQTQSMIYSLGFRRGNGVGRGHVV